MGAPTASSTDAEIVLRRARRPLVIGMGGGGDVVGALATAEHARRYDAAEPMVGGVTWERRAIDPEPGPRKLSEIADGEVIAPGVMLAGSRTRVPGREVYFAESRMAEFLGERTVLVDVHDGPSLVAAGLAEATERLDRDLLVFVDVGGDVLARGDEPGLRSPLCDAIMLAAAGQLQRQGYAVLLGVFGLGCDAELTPEEVLARLAEVAAEGGLLGMRGLTGAVAERLEQATRLVPTEASAQAVSAFRGAAGPQLIRGGAATVQLTTTAAATFYLDVAATLRACGRLAEAVAPAAGLHQANRALGALGVRTELDLETDAARATS